MAFFRTSNILANNFKPLNEALYVMTIEQSLEFLVKHQPMPSDLIITEEQCEQFLCALELFQSVQDPRCVPLLINCISEHTGMGMYEIISDVLINQERRGVIENLKLGLQSPDNAIKYRCCWWALDLDAWELTDLIEPLVASNIDDLRDAAEAFIDISRANV